MAKIPNFMEQIAQEKIGVPEEEWLPFLFKSEIGGFIITGGKPVYYVIKSKKDKIKTYAKPHSTVIVTPEEIKARRQAYIEEHTCCPDCLGLGKHWVGWSKAEGTKYKPCTTCNQEQEQL
jgi:hypothetical protein